MPKYVQLPRLSESEAHLVQVLGMNQVRLSIIKSLAAHDKLTTTELSEDLGGEVQLVTLLRHMRTLEQAGVVEADTPPGERQGRSIDWKLLREPLRSELAQLVALLD